MRQFTPEEIRKLAMIKALRQGQNRPPAQIRPPSPMPQPGRPPGMNIPPNPNGNGLY